MLENDFVWGAARTISDVPAVLVERLQHYFLTYKLVPGQGEPARLATVYGRTHAREWYARRWRTTTLRSPADPESARRARSR